MSVIEIDIQSFLSANDFIIGHSHLPRFDHDCNRGHHREGIGIIVTDLIRSYLILMSIVAIGLIVIFSTIIPIDIAVCEISAPFVVF